MRQNTKLTILFSLVASLLMFYIFNRTAAIYVSMAGNVVEKINAAIDQLLQNVIAKPFLIATSQTALLSGAVGAAAVWLTCLYNYDPKKFMRGIEHGSARWGTARDIRPLIDPVPDRNIILSATEKISIGKGRTFEADRNNNVLVVGGPGSGKTQGLIKPALLQLYGSYVITDTKGSLLLDTGHMFIDNGYAISTFNTIDFSKSLHYNPLAYIRSEKDILKVVNVLIENTKGEGFQSGEKFWVDCERLLYTAIIAYLRTSMRPEEQNIPTMIKMLELCQVKEEDEDYKSPIDFLFEELEEEQPDCLAVKQYKKFRQAAGKTMKSILISCAARLAPFDIEELREITLYDELQLDEIGDRKTAFFVIMSDTDSTYSFLIAMIMYQMFDLLTAKADNEYGGRLPFHVRCLLDEFANIGRIPDFQRLISTIRSREISCMIILQSFAQLKSAYKDDADIIIDCCDSMVYLGGRSSKTTKELVEMIGKTTIDNQNINENKGKEGSYSINNQILGRDLIDASEIARLKKTECLVLITGLPPFKSKKYPTHKHKRYKQIADGGRERFDIRELNQREEQWFFSNITSVQEIDFSEMDMMAR